VAFELTAIPRLVRLAAAFLVVEENLAVELALEVTFLNKRTGWNRRSWAACRAAFCQAGSERPGSYSGLCFRVSQFRSPRTKPRFLNREEKSYSPCICSTKKEEDSSTSYLRTIVSKC
jgi:hypothetical protein